MSIQKRILEKFKIVNENEEDNNRRFTPWYDGDMIIQEFFDYEYKSSDNLDAFYGDTNDGDTLKFKVQDLNNGKSENGFYKTQIIFDDDIKNDSSLNDKFVKFLNYLKNKWKDILYSKVEPGVYEFIAKDNEDK